MLDALCTESGIRVQTMTAAGNTTMLHLFCGVSPVGMGAYPFTPAFLEMKTIPGADLGLPVETVITTPGAIQLTRTPESPTSLASALVKEMIAPLVAE